MKIDHAFGENTIAIFLAGIPKVFGALNVAIYYWDVCHKELLRFGGRNQ